MFSFIHRSECVVCVCVCGWVYLWTWIWVVNVNKLNPNPNRVEMKHLGIQTPSAIRGKALSILSIFCANVDTHVFRSEVCVRGNMTSGALNSYLRHAELTEPRNPAAIGL